jgi:lipoprotein-anchoring transpeptidase ErfK/SrfK
MMSRRESRLAQPMTPPTAIFRTVRHLVVVLCSMVVILTPDTASAQAFLSFLWSGGSRETVSFHPSHAPGQIIVSFGDRRLYLVHRRGEAISYPIAIPREKSRWSGNTVVSAKRVNPGWTPTAEMRRENPRLPAHVPGGHPLNPLGVRALYLGSSLYRIHGTDAPWTIGTAASKGCIRLYNEDVLDLYRRVPVGTRVTVTWRRYRT